MNFMTARTAKKIILGIVYAVVVVQTAARTTEGLPRPYGVYTFLERRNATFERLF